MDFSNWSSIGRKRFVVGIATVVGVVVGFGMAFLEDSMPEYSVLVAVLALMAIVGALAYRYRMRMEQTGVVDERSKRITHKATKIAWSGLVLALTVLVSIPTFSDLEVPIVFLVWICLVGSIVLQELAKEYYRRQM